MREIWFRGKETETGDWVDGFYICLNCKEHRIYSGYAETDCGDYYPDYYSVVPETVGQFTGLTDKDDGYIFEGDIVVRQFSTDIPMLVKYDDEAAQFIVEYTMYGERYENTLCGHMYLEVIGNIHDNPELLG